MQLDNSTEAFSGKCCESFTQKVFAVFVTFLHSTDTKNPVKMTRTKYNNLIKVSRKNITDKYLYFLKVLKLRKELKSIPLSAIYMYIYICVCI